MLKFGLAALLSSVLPAACAGAVSEPTATSRATASLEASGTSSASPLPSRTERPTVAPEPTPTARLVAACLALDEIHQLAEVLPVMTESAYTAFETDDPTIWEAGSTALGEQLLATLDALDAITGTGFDEWQLLALEVVSGINDVAVLYDDGVATSDLEKMEAGNAAMDALAPAVEAMNEEASDFEAHCPS